MKSTDIAIKLIDKARELGVPAKLEVSLVTHSDSRYVIMPGAVIRISSHAPFEPRYSLSLDARLPGQLEKGLNWMEKKYVRNDNTTSAPEIQEARARSIVAGIPDRGRRRDGLVHNLARSRVSRDDHDPAHRTRRRGSFGVRAADPQPKWTSSEARRVRDERDWDD